ncbi:MAG: hypothetical protein K9L30_07535 [Desulfobacterales bacterium]|nr:hypothetical protein [Desulfobacterales bacterium]
MEDIQPEKNSIYICLNDNGIRSEKKKEPPIEDPPKPKEMPPPMEDPSVPGRPPKEMPPRRDSEEVPPIKPPSRELPIKMILM